MAKRKKHKHIIGKSADMALQKELHRQVGIIYSAVAIALHRYWGWGKDRIISLADMTREVWHECAKTNLRSMPQMLEEETGVEVQCGDGTSWHQLAFLNADITKYDRMTNEQFLYMRAKQVRWVAPNVMSCLLLSLYRRCGFGGDKRLPRVAAQIAGVREEFGNSEEALRAACLEETGISIVDYMDTHEVEVSEE